VSYKRPWFQLVYEDGDAEDMTMSEKRRLEWTGKVPAEKILKCVNQARAKNVCPAKVAGLDEVLEKQEHDAAAAAAAASSWALSAPEAEGDRTETERGKEELDEDEDDEPAAGHRKRGAAAGAGATDGRGGDHKRARRGQHEGHDGGREASDQTDDDDNDDDIVR
jgi:hypothetical protein